MKVFCNSVVEAGNYENNFNALKNAIKKNLLFLLGAGENLYYAMRVRDEDLINVIYTICWIAGPASDYNAMYTALMCANRISVWSCGENPKTVISCDLDLYEKVYLLVTQHQSYHQNF